VSVVLGGVETDIKSTSDGAVNTIEYLAHNQPEHCCANMAVHGRLESDESCKSATGGQNVDAETGPALILGGLFDLHLFTLGVVARTLGSVRVDRSKLERLWIVASLAYGGLRTAIVWRYLKEYGVNVYAFGFVEFSTAAIYGLSSARIVGAVVDRNKRGLMRWSPIALTSFFAPDVFVFLSAGEMPASLLEVLISVVVGTTLLGIVSLVSQVRKARSTLIG